MTQPLPPGFQWHDTAPGWIYNVSNPQEMYQWPPPAPAQPAAPAAAAPAAAPSNGLPTAYVDPDAAPPEYGENDVEAATQEYQTLKSRGGKHIWLNFGKVEREGDESYLRLRLLPPWKGSRKSWFNTMRYRIPGALVPESDKKIEWVTSYDVTGGPGDCPIAKALEACKGSSNPDAQKAAKDWRGKVSMFWQALNLEDLQAHYVQRKDAAGAPVMDPTTGQPIYDLMPGIVEMGPKLHQAVLAHFKPKGDPTNLNSGYPLYCLRTKTGPQDMNVEYSATPLDAEPLADNLRPVLYNLINLQDDAVNFRTPDVQHAIAQNILARFGIHASTAAAVPAAAPVQPPAAAQPPAAPPAPAAPPVAAQPPAAPPAAPPAPPVENWVTHPDNPAYEYIPGTQQMREKPKPPAPPPAPPVAPAAAPPVPTPPAAPVGAPGAAQAAYQPPPAVPPGMPAGAPPPPPPAAGAAMTPGQLEQQLAGGGPVQPPGVPPAAHGAPPPPPAPTDDGTPF